MKQQIIVSGLGGQGALTLTRLLAEAALALGSAGHHFGDPRHGPAGRHGHLHGQGGAFSGTPDPGRGGGRGLFLQAKNLAVHRFYLKPEGAVFVNTATPGDYLNVDAQALAQAQVCRRWRPTLFSWATPPAGEAILRAGSPN